ncbi:Ig-like domain-containing protein [Maribacter antarcticus]|uniref:Ig-like domain-containing protein n=1 Tax=Maribacter antarcticus TaxID=505250 RepID=UPI000478C123|nr:Ig-like domain-containing protein [Maribacter antarcticus]
MNKVIAKTTVTIFMLFIICFLITTKLCAQKSVPVATDDNYSARLNRVLSIDAIAGLLSNDTDANPGTILSVNPNPVIGPANGVVSISSDGSFTYSPNTGFVGADLFQYQVCDNGVPNSIVSQFDFDTSTLTAATLGPNATSVNPNAVQTSCGIRIGSGGGGSAGLDFVVPNTNNIFNFTGFSINFEYQDQEGTADIITAGNFRIYHISANALGIKINITDGSTGFPASYTQILGGFLGGSASYTIAYNPITGAINYTANGTLTVYNVAPPNFSARPLIGVFADNWKIHGQ